MATVNGLGTMRYDWSRRDDDTAEATIWFVIFFFPIIPIRREHLRVVRADYERVGFGNTLAAILGSGSGWKTEIEVLDQIDNPIWRVLLTYVKGFIVVPFITFIGPLFLLVFVMPFWLKKGQPPPDWIQIALPVFSIGILIWTAVVVARIMDMAAGRFHVSPICKVTGKRLRKASLRHP